MASNTGQEDMQPASSSIDQPSTSRQNPVSSQDGGIASGTTPSPNSGHKFSFTKVLDIPKYKLKWSEESSKIIIKALEDDYDTIIYMDESSVYYVRLTITGTTSTVGEVETVLNELVKPTEDSDSNSSTPEEQFSEADIYRTEAREWRIRLNKLDLLQKYFVKRDIDQITIRANILIEATEPSSALANPAETFYNIFGKYPIVLQKIYEQGLIFPSHLQWKALPIILRGDNTILIGPTGTGKTLTYLLPALIHVNTKPSPRLCPSVLILAPTAELVDQIEAECMKFELIGIKSIGFHSGECRKEKINSILDGMDIIIATPRKLINLTTHGHINCANFSFVVFDDADLILDSPELRYEITKLFRLHHPHQTVVISATWPSRFNFLADFMTNFTKIIIGGLLNTVQTVLQLTVLLHEGEKMNLLFNILNKLENEKIIIFCNSSQAVEKISTELCNMDIQCESIHEYIDYYHRKNALEKIMSGYSNVLVATDLVSRGIDFKDITFVVNVDFPRRIENYVYRVGRVGRAEKRGIAINFFTSHDMSCARPLIRILEDADQNVPEGLTDLAVRFDWLSSTSDIEEMFY